MRAVCARLAALTVALCCSVAPSPGHAFIYAQRGNSTHMSFDDLPSFFGSRLPKDGLMGVLVESHPLNACSPIDPPPQPTHFPDGNITKFIVLIRRYDCNFDIKVLHAQQAGFSAAIVHNWNSDLLLNMASSNDTISDQIDIPSVFTSYSAFLALKEYIIPVAGAYVILIPESSFPLAYYLIPFTGVMGMIILIMVTILIVRCVQHRKRARRNRLTKEQLKKIPVHKFKKGDEYDMCAICLDEYEDGDKLRILPCSHAYHCRCVDPWLTQTKKTCPVCKQRVVRPDSESEDDEEEEEEGGGAGLDTETERTPLLRASQPGSPSSDGYPGGYASTAMTTEQPAPDSPLLAHDRYYSPEEDSEEEEEADEASSTNEDLAPLIGRGEVCL